MTDLDRIYANAAKAAKIEIAISDAVGIIAGTSAALVFGHKFLQEDDHCLENLVIAGLGVSMAGNRILAVVHEAHVKHQVEQYHDQMMEIIATANR